MAAGVAPFTGEGVARAGEAGCLSKVLTVPLGSLMISGFRLPGLVKLDAGAGLLLLPLLALGVWLDTGGAAGPAPGWT